jgi:hypothetical protein
VCLEALTKHCWHQRRLMCCGKVQGHSMLQDATAYMSSVDLSAVCGQHHVAVGRGGAWGMTNPRFG